MDIISLKKELKERGEADFRFKQIKQAYFFGTAEKWEDIMTLSRQLRTWLAENIPFDSIKIEKVINSKDKRTHKAVFSLEDGKIIEGVLMEYGDRITACVSSQVGCNLKCQFCATGASGYSRDLSPSEIYEQIVLWNRYLKGHGRISSVVFMGMGEPMLNWDNVRKAIEVMNGKEELNIGSRHISVSTAGIVPGIREFTRLDSQINLAISLNAPDDRLRSSLMPINKKYPLKELMSACQDYVKKTKRKLFFEYVMIKGVNDSAQNAEDLAGLLWEEKLFHVNLIPYNTTGGRYSPSPRGQMEKFFEILRRMGVSATIRHSFGKEVKAACGQLA